MTRLVDRSGVRYGRLTPQYRTDRRPGVYWMCDCDCGGRVEVLSTNLRPGNTTSCGCVSRTLSRQRRTTHGRSRTPESDAWNNMRVRCYNPANPSYGDYGGRGIRVCERWRGGDCFAAFYADLGPKPSRLHMLDRIDNDGYYSCGKCAECLAVGRPMNCRWATRTEQNRNKRSNVWLTARGERMLLSDFAPLTGLFVASVYDLLARGWTPDDILSARPAPES
jgi:hypothetical protein